MAHISGKKLILPFYHLVSDKNPSHISSLYSHKNRVDFIADLDYLLKHFTPISLQELLHLKKNNKPFPSNSFHLTFDDGLSEFYNVVAPILLDKKIPATVFLNANFIDNKALFYRYKASILSEELFAENLLQFSYQQKEALDELASIFEIKWENYLKNTQPYLTSNQINELIKQGFTFGSHSNDHPLYNTLTLNEQVEQTLESVEKITTSFQLDYRVFSFPFTDDKVSNHFFKKISSKVDLTFGSAGIKDDTIKTNLQRIPMETAFNAEMQIKTQYVSFLLKRLIGKQKIKRR